MSCVDYLAGNGAACGGLIRYDHEHTDCDGCWYWPDDQALARTTPHEPALSGQRSGDFEPASEFYRNGTRRAEPRDGAAACRVSEVPLRERNQLLTAAGFAPVFQERPFDDQSMQPARTAVEQILKGHEPYPALAIDRHWNLVSANGAVAALIADADPSLLEPPVNVLRLSLHPRGWRRRLRISGNGARIYLNGWGVRSHSRPIRSWPRCAMS